MRKNYKILWIPMRCRISNIKVVNKYHAKLGYTCVRNIENYENENGHIDEN